MGTLSCAECLASPDPGDFLDKMEIRNLEDAEQQQRGPGRVGLDLACGLPRLEAGLLIPDGQGAG